MLLENEELKNIKGGSVCWACASIIAAAGVFIIGFVDGFLRPFKCR